MSKLQEADTLMREGEKATQVVFFGLLGKPDWGLAASKFEKAATAYRVSHKFNQACQAFKKSADAHYKNGIVFTAAKHTETAAQLYQQLGEPIKSSKEYEAASLLYAEADNPLKRGECLMNAAQVIEEKDLSRAFELVKQAMEVYSDERQEKHADKLYNYANTLFITNKKYGEAIELFYEQISGYLKNKYMPDVWKCYLSIVILHLAQDDFVAANQKFREFCNTDDFPRSDEFSAAMLLLEAFEENDKEKLDKAKKAYCLNHLPLAVSKLVRTLNITGTVASKPTSTTAPTNPLEELASYDKEEDITTGLG